MNRKQSASWGRASAEDWCKSLHLVKPRKGKRKNVIDVKMWELGLFDPRKQPFTFISILPRPEQPVSSNTFSLSYNSISFLISLYPSLSLSVLRLNSEWDTNSISIPYRGEWLSCKSLLLKYLMQTHCKVNDLQEHSNMQNTWPQMLQKYNSADRMKIRS